MRHRGNFSINQTGLSQRRGRAVAEPHSCHCVDAQRDPWSLVAVLSTPHSVTNCDALLALKKRPEPT